MAFADVAFADAPTEVAAVMPSHGRTGRVVAPRDGDVGAVPHFRLRVVAAPLGARADSVRSSSLMSLTLANVALANPPTLVAAIIVAYGLLSAVVVAVAILIVVLIPVPVSVDVTATVLVVPMVDAVLPPISIFALPVLIQASSVPRRLVVPGLVLLILLRRLGGCQARYGQ